MEQWRKDMNAALGTARALASQGQTQAAVDAASRAASLAQTSAAATAAVNLRQQIYASNPPISQPTQMVVDYGPRVFSGNSGGSGQSYPPAPAPIPAPPPPPKPTTFSVKQPSPSLVQYDSDSLPQELLSDLLYEDVGGQELINISRHDIIDGQNVSYSLIRNLSILNQSFNPNNILAGQITYSNQLGQYALDIVNKITSSGNPAYLDSDGNLVIELLSANDDEYLEVQISSNGTIYTG